MVHQVEMFRGEGLGVVIRAGFLGKEGRKGSDRGFCGQWRHSSRLGVGEVMRVGTGSPVKSACRRASHISCLLQLDTHIAQGSFRPLRMSTEPVGLELNSLKTSRNAGGGEGAGEQGEPMHRNPDISPL